MVTLKQAIYNLEHTIHSFRETYNPQAAERELIATKREAERTTGIKYNSEVGSLEKNLDIYYILRKDASNALKYAHDAKGLSDIGIIDNAVTNIGKVIGQLNNFILNIKLNEEKDKYGAILRLHIGHGGDKLKPYLESLAKAYLQFAKTQSFDVKQLPTKNAHEIALQITGQGKVYGLLKKEHGTHRIEYVGDRSKMQTGYISVIVEPINPTRNHEVRDEDLSYESVSGNGPGGRNANSRLNGVRITHKPTGLSASARTRETRSNIKTALRVLSGRIKKHGEANLQPDKRDVDIPTFGNGIRTYDSHEMVIVDKVSGARISADPLEIRAEDIGELILAGHGINSYYN